MVPYCKKTDLDLWKYFLGLQIGFGSTLKGWKNGFGCLPKD